MGVYRSIVPGQGGRVPAFVLAGDWRADIRIRGMKPAQIEDKAGFRLHEGLFSVSQVSARPLYFRQSMVRLRRR